MNHDIKLEEILDKIHKYDQKFKQIELQIDQSDFQKTYLRHIPFLRNLHPNYKNHQSLLYKRKKIVLNIQKNIKKIDKLNQVKYPS